MLINKQAQDDLIDCWKSSPYPSIKTSSYFPVYSQVFQHLRGTSCTFVETGILDGGSLFMWRNWLGDKARVVGIDLNPEAKKWEEFGFEIHIGDQGDPNFWRSILPKIGKIDAFLDDGGHQSFQQIVTVSELLRYLNNQCVVAVEDTYTSFMKDFSSHGNHSFLEFAKDATDCLTGRSFSLYPNRFASSVNDNAIRHFEKVFGINFYNGLVVFQVNPEACIPAQIVRNQDKRNATDFRYEGKNSALVEWPNVLRRQEVIVKGAK